MSYYYTSNSTTSGYGTYTITYNTGSSNSNFIVGKNRYASSTAPKNNKEAKFLLKQEKGD
jgi:hypothetical protein